MLVQQRGKALVAGGSLGGLLAANLLLRDGWDVHVFERASEELEGRGAGLVTHIALHARMKAALRQICGRNTRRTPAICRSSGPRGWNAP